MARFGVYRMHDGDVLVLDCQADLLDNLPTRFVVPLIPASLFRDLYPRLNPVFDIDGIAYFMATQMAATVPCNRIGDRQVTLADKQDAIMNALDMLLTGY